MKVSFSVDVVAGKERPRHSRDGHVYTPARTRANEQKIWAAYATASLQTYGRIVQAPVKEPVYVEIRAIESLSEHVRVSRPFVGKPDVDNIAKLVCDALNPGHLRVGAWSDDSQVTSLVALKLPGTPGRAGSTHITIKWGEVDDEREQQQRNGDCAD